MKLYISLLVCMFAVGVLHAQQRPQYTQYILNQYVLNPALAGIESYTDLKISARDQWTGLRGAPRTAYLTVNAALGKSSDNNTATSFRTPGENPLGKAYWENYTAAPAHHGIGLTVLNYSTGLYNRFSAGVSYAYHIGLSPRTNLAAGFTGGFSKLAYKAAEATPSDPSDPAIYAGNKTLYKTTPDLAVGLWLYDADFFVGISAQQLVPQRVQWNDATTGFDLVPHLFATAGYRILVSDDVNMLPSVMLKFVPNTPTRPQADVNLKFQYQDILWVGASYRQGNGFAGMMGAHLGRSLNLGYAYDFTRTALNTASRGSHEIVLGFLLGNRYADTCPRNVW